MGRLHGGKVGAFVCAGGVSSKRAVERRLQPDCGGDSRQGRAQWRPNRHLHCRAEQHPGEPAGSCGGIRRQRERRNRAHFGGAGPRAGDCWVKRAFRHARRRVAAWGRHGAGAVAGVPSRLRDRGGGSAGLCCPRGHVLGRLCPCEAGGGVGRLRRRVGGRRGVRPGGRGGNQRRPRRLDDLEERLKVPLWHRCRQSGAGRPAASQRLGPHRARVPRHRGRHCRAVRRVGQAGLHLGVVGVPRRPQAPGDRAGPRRCAPRRG
mmetsp:Transcript_24627/g.93089  ORF Transcript_24627/g.93089 Transcript_24627/m.93089 type:complete len:262 (+) Transcript_24627:505-1290(+)